MTDDRGTTVFKYHTFLWGKVKAATILYKRQGYWYIDVHRPILDGSSGLRSDAVR